MKTGLSICIGLLLLGAAGMSTAVAQPIYVAPRPGYGPGLPPQAIVSILRAAGLAPLTQPVRRGPRRYVVVAADRSGQHLRVVVDAYGGRIIRVNPVVAMRQPPGVRLYPLPPGVVPAPRYSGPPPVAPDPRNPPIARGPQYGAGQSLSPPGAVPNSQLAGVPRATGSLPSARPRPATTPLPRPRPTIAANNAAAETAGSSPAPAPAQPQAAPADSKPPAATGASPATPEAPALVPVAPLE